MTAEASTESTEKPHIVVGVTRKPDGELDYSKAAVPIGDTLTQIEGEFADQKASKKAERDEHFMQVDKNIEDREGTPDVLFFRIQKIREMNKGIFSDNQPDSRSEALDQRLHLEQGILNEASQAVESEKGTSFEQMDAFLESKLDFAHKQFESGESIHGPLFGMLETIDPNDLISAINDLQEKLKQEQDRARVRKMGSEVAKKTVEL